MGAREQFEMGIARGAVVGVAIAVSVVCIVLVCVWHIMTRERPEEEEKPPQSSPNPITKTSNEPYSPTTEPGVEFNLTDPTKRESQDLQMQAESFTRVETVDVDQQV